MSGYTEAALLQLLYVKTRRRKTTVEFQVILSVILPCHLNWIKESIYKDELTQLLPSFHLEGLTVWLLSSSLRSVGSSTVTSPDCVLTFIGWLMLTHWWVAHKARLRKWPDSSLRSMFPWSGPSVWAGEGLPACKCGTVINLIIHAVSSACPVTCWSFVSIKGWKEQIRSRCLIICINKPKRGMNGQCGHKTYCQSALSWTGRLTVTWHLYYVISCFTLKFCPHLSCVASRFLLFVRFPSTFSVSTCVLFAISLCVVTALHFFFS